MQVTVYTAERMKEIEDTTVVGGLVDPQGNLLLTTREGTEINAGLVKGEDGEPGQPGQDGIDALDGTPAGTIALWASDVAPANWLICDGSAVSRSLYPSLFDAIGIKYGAGDGVNTFNLPNLKGRSPVGKDSAQTEFNLLGKAGGSKTHLLTAAQSGVPAHSHSYSPAYYLSNGNVAQDGSAIVGGSRSTIYPNVSAYSAIPLQSTSPSTAASAAEAHNILQPYSVVNFIIKAVAGETTGDDELTQRISALEANFSGTPAGTMTMWGSDEAPTNWLLCDGAAVSRTTYASLFAAIGTKYGGGDGVTTFNLPDIRGRVPVGRSNNSPEFGLLGATGGSKTATLTVAQLPAHSHSLTRNGSRMIHVESSGADTAGTNRWRQAVGAEGGGLYDAATQSVGAGEGHNNIQPYQVVNYIIKITNGDTKGDSQLTQRVSALEVAAPQALAIREKVHRLQMVLTGGGIRRVSAAGIGWSTQFISIGAGRDALAPSGYFLIGMPANGTVIPVHGGAVGATVTVANAEIPLSNNRALYYDVPLNGAPASDPSRFKIVDYLGTFAVPDTWVFLAIRNVDTYTHSVMWGDGRPQDHWRALALASGWIQFGGWSAASWRLTSGGSIRLKGLIANGSNAAPIFTFDPVLSPLEPAIYLQAASGGQVRMDIGANGQLITNGYLGGANNGWVSLENVEWYPRGA